MWLRRPRHHHQLRKAVLTGNKLEKKVWYRHTGWIGGLKEVKYATPDGDPS